MTKLGYNVNAKRTVESILLVKKAMQYKCFIGYGRLQFSKCLYRYVCTNFTSSRRTENNIDMWMDLEKLLTSTSRNNVAFVFSYGYKKYNL